MPEAGESVVIELPYGDDNLVCVNAIVERMRVDVDNITTRCMAEVRWISSGAPRKPAVDMAKPENRSCLGLQAANVAAKAEKHLYEWGRAEHEIGSLIESHAFAERKDAASRDVFWAYMKALMVYIHSDIANGVAETKEAVQELIDCR